MVTDIQTLENAFFSSFFQCNFYAKNVQFFLTIPKLCYIRQTMPTKFIKYVVHLFIMPLTPKLCQKKRRYFGAKLCHLADLSLQTYPNL